jgi:hypothetical protein
VYEYWEIAYFLVLCPHWRIQIGCRCLGITCSDISGCAPLTQQQAHLLLDSVLALSIY